MPPEEEVSDVGSDSQEVESSVSEASPVSAESPQQGAAAPTGQAEVWGAFRQLPQFQGADDRAIASRLYEALQREEHATRALQQYQSIIPVASEYLSNREMFEQWRQSQAQQQQNQQPQAAPAPQEQQTPWWNPPKIKDSYRQYLVRDENGREIIDPNAPLEVRHALQEYQQYRADFAKKFLENPEQALGPMVERVATERAAEIFQQRMARMEEENYVTGIESENKDWLYDEQGNASPEGLLAQKYIQDARQLGINGAQARWDYATRMVERDLLLQNMRQMQQYQQQMQQAQQAPAPPAVNPADAAAQRNMEYLRQQAMRTASQRPAQATTDARVPKKPMSFAEKLAANLHGEGMMS